MFIGSAYSDIEQYVYTIDMALGYASLIIIVETSRKKTNKTF